MTDPAGRSGPQAPDGVLLVDKPSGITSHDVVDRVRLLVRPMKVGHTGTLDPFATGLLPLCLGRATRLSRFLSLSDKTYEGWIQLGARTNTYDRDGEVVVRGEVPPDWRERADRCLKGFQGLVRLVPPPFSAKKVMGKPLYEFARAEIHIKRKPVESWIHEMEILECGQDSFRFRARVSAGTYLRSLAEALGMEVGCGAHLRELRRVGVGELRIEAAIALGRLEQEAAEDPDAVARRVLPLRSIPLGLRTLAVNAAGRAAVLNGRRFGPGGLSRSPGPADRTHWRVEDGESGELLGIAETVSRPGAPPRALWRPVLVFPPDRAEGTLPPRAKVAGRRNGRRAAIE